MVWAGVFLVDWILFGCYILGVYNYFAIQKLMQNRHTQTVQAESNKSHSSEEHTFTYKGSKLGVA